jgi:hypothetical protein
VYKKDGSRLKALAGSRNYEMKVPKFRDLTPNARNRDQKGSNRGTSKRQQQ